MMKARMICMVDAGFLTRSSGSLLKGKVTIEGEEVVHWSRVVAKRLSLDFLRAYWYDGAYPESNRELYSNQRKRFDDLEKCSGLQLRLGHLENRPFDFKPALKRAAESLGVDYRRLMNEMNLERIYQQKGVDTLLVLDMIRLVQQNSCRVILLIAGDRDLAEAVRTVQGLGATVILAHPERGPIADELRDLADDRIILTENLVRSFTTKFKDRRREMISNLVAEMESDDQNVAVGPT